MTPETLPPKDTPMNANAHSVSGRAVEITDEDKNIIIAFIPNAPARGPNQLS